MTPRRQRALASTVAVDKGEVGAVGAVGESRVKGSGARTGSSVQLKKKGASL